MKDNMDVDMKDNMDVDMKDEDGHNDMRSSSTSSREVPVMDTSRLRMLPFGTAVLMLRAARPIVLTMTSWTQRPDAAQLQGSRRRLEGVIERASSPAFEPLVS